MDVSTALLYSVQSSIISLTVRKGIPVLPNGEVSQIMVETGYALSAWHDRDVKKHVAGGYRYDDWQKRWVTVDGCQWILDNAFVSKQDMSDEEVTLEVSGLLCSCGQHYEKTVRYQGPKATILKEITKSMAEKA